MVTLFRKVLIRSGKVIPFVLAFVVAFGYIESAYAIHMELFEECEDGSVILYTPISNYIGSVIYIDWFDVLLLYVLAVALEFCWRNMLAVHYLLLNLAIRTLVEHFYLVFKFLNTKAFRNGTDDDAEPFGLDALDELFEACTLFG